MFFFCVSFRSYFPRVRGAFPPNIGGCSPSGHNCPWGVRQQGEGHCIPKRKKWCRGLVCSLPTRTPMLQCLLSAGDGGPRWATEARHTPLGPFSRTPAPPGRRWAWPRLPPPGVVVSAADWQAHVAPTADGGSTGDCLGNREFLKTDPAPPFSCSSSQPGYLIGGYLLV